MILFQKSARLFFRLVASSLVVVGILGFVRSSHAQTYIEPSDQPYGGRSSSFIDTTSSTQYKTGSLTIGDGVPPNEALCLNAPASGDRLTQAECVNDWSALISVVGGPFVRTHRNTTITNPGNASPVNCAADPLSYYCLADSGYAYLRGNGATLATYLTTANYTLNPSVALYATNEGDQTSYAAYFNGSVSIDRHSSLGPGPQPPLGQLCLNSTATYNATGPLPRYGCISNWSDLSISGPITPYIKLQQSNPPTEFQQGAARVNQAFQFGSVVTGGETFIAPVGSYCGDGLCSSNIGEIQATCAIDCGNPPPPPGGCFTAGTTVDTPRGSVAIAKLRIGDMVYAFDEQTQQRVIAPIVNVIVHEPQAYGLVTFGDGTALEVTMVHRFFRPDRGTWQSIGTMTSGDRVLRAANGLSYTMPIRGVQRDAGTAPVYNLTVQQYHNYYVKGILVHNTKPVIDF